MFKFFFGFIALLPMIHAVHFNNSVTRTGMKLLDKFRQHDYKLHFERFEVVRYNKNYVKTCQAVTFKYNRTCAAVNYTNEWKVDMGFDLEIIAQVYRFASNEYRLYSIRMEYNFCDALAKNAMGTADLVNCEHFTACPLVKKKVYRGCNWSPNPQHFPPLIPDGQYMVELQGLYKSTEMYLQRAYGTISRPISIP